MKRKSDTNVVYIRINSIDEIDFENLPETAKKQLARMYANLLKQPLKSAIENNQRGEILTA